MRVEVITPWKHHRVGAVLDIPDGAANVLIKRGKVEEIDPQGGELETAAFAAPAKRQRGRPRK